MRRKIFHRWHTYRGHSELWNYGFVELFWGNYGIMELWNYGIIWNDGNSGNVACVSTPVVESPLTGPAQFHSDGSWSHSRHCRGYVPGGVGHWRLSSGSAGRQLLAGSRRMITLATATLLHLRSWPRSALFFRSHFSRFLWSRSQISIKKNLSDFEEFFLTTFCWIFEFWTNSSSGKEYNSSHYRCSRSGGSASRRTRTACAGRRSRCTARSRCPARTACAACWGRYGEIPEKLTELCRNDYGKLSQIIVTYLLCMKKDT